MKKILILLFGLYTLTSYSQENDDVYWTVYDVDTVEEETTTTITNNYYTNYTSRINRFHRRPYYASYWSYYNFYYYPIYNGYWWYNPYKHYSWHWSPYYNYAYWYSYYPTYHYAHNHHHPHLRTSNPNKKTVVNTPRKKIQKNHPKYQKPKQVKYIHIQTNVSKRPKKTFNYHPTIPNKTHPDRPKISSPSRVTGPPRKVKLHPSKIQHVKPKTNKSR